VHKQY